MAHDNFKTSPLKLKNRPLKKKIIPRLRRSLIEHDWVNKKALPSIIICLIRSDQSYLHIFPFWIVNAMVNIVHSHIVIALAWPFKKYYNLCISFAFKIEKRFPILQKQLLCLVGFGFVFFLITKLLEFKSYKFQLFDWLNILTDHI